MEGDSSLFWPLVGMINQHGHFSELSELGHPSDLTWELRETPEGAAVLLSVTAVSLYGDAKVRAPPGGRAGE